MKNFKLIVCSNYFLRKLLIRKLVLRLSAGGIEGSVDVNDIERASANTLSKTLRRAQHSLSPVCQSSLCFRVGVDFFLNRVAQATQLLNEQWLTRG